MCVPYQKSSEISHVLSSRIRFFAPEEKGKGRREERLLMDVLFARGLFKFKSTRFLLVLEAR